MSQLRCSFLLLRILAILVTERSGRGKLVHANVCVDTCRDKLRAVKQDEALDIIRLAAEQ